MADTTIAIVLNDGTVLQVSKLRLTADSRKFRYLIEDLKQNELQFDDFSPDIVTLFVTLLDDKELQEINNDQFRELNKLSMVFEVQWLKGSCKKWLKSKIEGIQTDGEKIFLFEECLYIIKKWEQREEMNALVSRLVTLDNESFLSKYLVDLAQLDPVQINYLLKIAGSNCELFLRAILANLDGKTDLYQSIKNLLSHMNLAWCFEQKQELYVKVCDVMQNLPDISIDNMRFAYQLSTETIISVTSRNEKRKTRTTLMYNGVERVKLLCSCNTVDDITAAISDGRITSMYQVVELLFNIFYESSPSLADCQPFLTKLENICSAKKLQRVSKQHLEMNILALNLSPLPQRVQLIALLNEIMENDTLSTCHENIIIKGDKEINVSKITGQRVLSKIKHIMTGDTSFPADTVFNDLYTFKHPSILECTQPSRCGFIVRFSKLEDNNMIVELSTNNKDYTSTVLHLHDVISASNMFLYNIHSGYTAPDNKIQVGGGWGRPWWRDWLPDVTDWKWEQRCVVYNISDYLVAKQD